MQKSKDSYKRQRSKSAMSQKGGSRRTLSCKSRQNSTFGAYSENSFEDAKHNNLKLLISRLKQRLKET